MFEIAGVKFKSESEMLDFIEDKLYWLRSHNKNYTKDQYFIIDMIYEMIKDYHKFGIENLTIREENENVCT